jgi:uncharacterized membrane-anchored protein YjiN (DUF445 family)
MTTTLTPPPTAAPPLKEADRRRRELKVMKTRATGLLVLMAGVFILVTGLGDDTTTMGYVRAGIEAALVGGLADWFAVTALFRHPLGLPIPHTAVIRERKDQFGRTLGEFVQENFLSPDVITARVRSSNIPERTAAWLSDPAKAEVAAGHLADLAVSLADAVRDDDVQRVLHEAIVRGVDSIPLAPLAGRALRMATAEDRHRELLDAGLRGLEHALVENEDQLREQFGRRSPWWLPGAVEDRIFDRILEGLRKLIEDVEGDPEHPLRIRLDTWLSDLTVRLEESPELRARGEVLKRELLEHPAVREWSTSLWIQIKVALREQAAAPGSELRRRLAGAIVATGTKLREDAALSAKAEDGVEAAVRYLADRFDDEIADLVSGTISRWDGQETSDKLELLLGRDLQFIRINGTVVGGLAGLAIHGIAQVIG